MRLCPNIIVVWTIYKPSHFKYSFYSFPLLSVPSKGLQYFLLTDLEGVKILWGKGWWAPHSYWHWS